MELTIYQNYNFKWRCSPEIYISRNIVHCPYVVNNPIDYDVLSLNYAYMGVSRLKKTDFRHTYVYSYNVGTLTNVDKLKLQRLSQMQVWIDFWLWYKNEYKHNQQNTITNILGD